MKPSFVLCFLILLAARCYAQEVTLSGTVRDATTREPVAYAIIQSAGRGTVGDAVGRFALNVLRQPKQSVIVSALGYRSDTFTLEQITHTENWSVNLAADTLTLIEVVATKVGYDLNPSLSVERLNALPSVLGEADVVKGLTLLPGVGAAREGLTGLHVRGGSDDQNLYLLDGSTIYNPGHLFGFLSVFNPWIIRNVDLYKNYIPAVYAKRLSSAVSVHTKQGGGQRRRRKEVGILGVNYMDAGTLRDSSLQYAGGLRLMHTSLLTLGSLPGYYLSNRPLLFAGMYDVNLKLTKRFSNGTTLSGSFFSGEDFFGNRIKSTTDAPEARARGSSLLRYGNRTAALRYFSTSQRGTLVESLFNYTGFQSRYAIREKPAAETLPLTFTNTSSITEFSLLHRRTVSVGNGQLSGGGELRYRSITPVALSFQQGDRNVRPTNLSFPTSHVAAFGDLELPLGNFLDWQLGLRIEHFANVAGNYSSVLFSPRSSLGWQIGSSNRLSITYQRATQPLHATLVFSGGLPTTFWLPADDLLPPESGQTVGVDYQRLRSNGKLKVGLYTRRMRDLVFLPNFTFSPSSNNASWRQDLVTGGQGRAYGIETYLEKKWNTYLLTSVSYTYSRSWRSFASFNNGKEFAYDLDRPHDLSLSIVYQHNAQWRTVGGFTFQSGLPISVPDALARDYTGEIQPVVRAYNNGRLRNYHRLDLLFEHRKEKKAGRVRTLRFGVYNIYGRPNPLSVSYTSRGRGVLNPATGERAFLNTPLQESLTLFRFIPMFSYAVQY